MCGIFGQIIVPNSNIKKESWQNSLTDLFILSESRGKEASGIAASTSKRIVIHKDSVSSKKMLATKTYRHAINPLMDEYFNPESELEYLSAIGHSRLVTNGLQGIDANNQPIRYGDFVLVHNGIVVNVDDLWKKMGESPKGQVDSEVICALLDTIVSGGSSLSEATQKAFNEIYGETSIAAFHAKSNALVMATNTGSLYWVMNPQKTSFFFASEKYICKELIKRNHFDGFIESDIMQVQAGEGVIINCKSLKSESFTFLEKLSTPAIAPLLQTQKKIEDKAEIIKQARNNMRRCTKCLLPETMPYIVYDNDGVCNYCHNYEPYTPKDDSEIRAEFDKIRSKDGSPDCVVAFSGGRDSSYGLHLLKTKYGMNPIAYTYDWGMVTDLARRNQARMCGKLGIEHLWLSADIKTKRAHIRRNLEAWLKKPDLGIIPLFMAGDKQFFWYANDTMKKTGLDTIVFCTNRLEKTDFKTGFLGIPPKDKTMRNNPSSLGLGSKFSMAWQYGRRFLTNPRYLNRSLPDTLWAYMSYYFINQDHLYLFDYISWNEEEVDKTLIGEYDWETAPDSDSTWRIGDGTAPFYNHIYLTVAGFTEHDTFRSNQIREGMISRKRGMELVETENVTRWDAIREYMTMINVDFDDAMRIIDRIPKLYI